ncbi:unnamed protein product [Lampetra planeri]
MTGHYTITIKYGRDEIPYSPYRIRALPTGDASKCTMTVSIGGHGLGVGVGPTIQINEETVITVDAKAAGKVTCSVSRPNGAELDVDMVENHDGTFDIYDTAPEPSNYTITVRFGGELVPNSPFHVLLGEHKVECMQTLENEKRRAREELDKIRGTMDFLKAELGVSRAEEAARAQELKESEGYILALGTEKAQQQDTHRKEACELATGLEEVWLTLADAFKQFERNSKKAQEDEDTITWLREELNASKEELAVNEAERASAQPELDTPQQGLSALQDQLATS